MFGEMFRRRVKDRPERLGCPVAAAAIARPEDPALAAAATEAFRSWEALIAAGEQAPLDSAVAGLHQALDSLLSPR